MKIFYGVLDCVALFPVFALGTGAWPESIPTGSGGGIYSDRSLCLAGCDRVGGGAVGADLAGWETLANAVLVAAYCGNFKRGGFARVTAVFVNAGAAPEYCSTR